MADVIEANTNELALSLTNRIYAKRGNDVVEILTWEVMQKRYFDPTFGGAIIPGQSNVFETTADVTAYSFVLGPRTYSPVASVLRANPVGGLTFQWLADYDPMYRRIVDSVVEVGYRWKKGTQQYYFNAGDNLVRSDVLLTPNADQYRFTVGFGDPQHRGWNAATTVTYGTLAVDGLSIAYREAGDTDEYQRQRRVLNQSGRHHDGRAEQSCCQETLAYLARIPAARDQAVGQQAAAQCGDSGDP